MYVLYCDMDAFYCSVEEQTRPSLQGKIVVVGGIERGVVASANYAARAYGVHSAMPIFLAHELLPYNAVYIPPRRNLYSYTSERVWKLIQSYSHVFEQISIDEACLTIDPAQYPDDTAAVSLAQEIQHRIYSTWGLTMSIGISSSKTYAKMLCNAAKPQGIVIKTSEQMRTYLQTLPLRTVPEIGAVRETKLNNAHLYTLEDICHAPRSTITHILGDIIGNRLIRIAQGEDRSMPYAHRHRKCVSAEQTFNAGIISRKTLQPFLHALIIDALARLHKHHYYATTVTLYAKTIPASHPDSADQQEDLSYINNYNSQYIVTHSLQHIETYEELVKFLYEIIPDPQYIGAIRLLGIRFSGLYTHKQLALFSADDSTESPPLLTTPTIDYSSSDIATTSNEKTDLPSSHPVAHCWKIGDDVLHDNYGFGWVHGVSTHRVGICFETHTTKPGKTHTFRITDPSIHRASSYLSWGDIISYTYDSQDGYY